MTANLNDVAYHTPTPHIHIYDNIGYMIGCVTVITWYLLLILVLKPGSGGAATPPSPRQASGPGCDTAELFTRLGWLVSGRRVSGDCVRSHSTRVSLTWRACQQEDEKAVRPARRMSQKREGARVPPVFWEEPPTKLWKHRRSATSFNSLIRCKNVSVGYVLRLKIFFKFFFFCVSSLPFKFSLSVIYIYIF